MFIFQDVVELYHRNDWQGGCETHLHRFFFWISLIWALITFRASKWHNSWTINVFHFILPDHIHIVEVLEYTQFIAQNMHSSTFLDILLWERTLLKFKRCFILSQVHRYGGIYITTADVLSLIYTSILLMFDRFEKNVFIKFIQTT